MSDTLFKLRKNFSSITREREGGEEKGMERKGREEGRRVWSIESVFQRIDRKLLFRPDVCSTNGCNGSWPANRRYNSKKRKLIVLRRKCLYKTCIINVANTSVAVEDMLIRLVRSITGENK